ncbi:Nucleotidyl transferase [Sulfurovum sp. enrichment culture clone C5]|uniref:Nucleotidyl transferase n=1 Tax=Sulfurovum sp. enrichment culture clone C5 TaxID=497650 RepID=A0A0S4XMZ2_9BACT|nr:Nucleotidyl transferase [Sulfurovum sp. enrichment culture clone C5]
MKKAMILAAGRGERMKPLTDTIPKPLLEVGGKPLIVWHIEKLANAGFEEIVINIAHLGYKIPEALGDGSKWGVKLHFSDEQKEGALESAGGIVKALPLFGNEPFLVVNGDVWCDYEFDKDFKLEDGILAHLILVPNPNHNQKGDFALKDTMLSSDGSKKYTFSGIGYYSPSLFKWLEYGKRGLGDVLREAMMFDAVSGELYNGLWRDIGTPERLGEINKHVKNI